MLLCWLHFDTKEHVTFLNTDVKFFMAGNFWTLIVLMAYAIFSSADGQVTRGCSVSKTDLRFALNGSVYFSQWPSLHSYPSRIIFEASVLHLFQAYSRTACKSETRC